VKKSNLESQTLVMGKVYTSKEQDTKDLLKAYSLNINIADVDNIMDGAYASGIQDLPNPGVQTALIFQSGVQTPSYYRFNSNPMIME